MTEFSRSVLVSDWATDNNPIVNEPAPTWADEDWHQMNSTHTRTERDFFKMPRKFFCKCGCESKGILQSVERTPRNPRVWAAQPVAVGQGVPVEPRPQQEQPLNTATELYFIKPTFVCPECGAAPDVILHWHQSNAHAELDFVHVFDNRQREENNTSIALSMGATRYYFNRKVRKLGVKSSLVRLTHNVHTGMTYAIKAKGRRALLNCSYANFPDWIREELLITSIKQPEKVDEFLRLMVGARLEWLTYEDVVGSQEDRFGRLMKVMFMSALPQLQCLPFKNYGMLSPKERKLIRQAGFNGKKLWELFAGTSAKQIRKLIKTENQLHDYRHYSTIITEPSNLHKLFHQQEENLRSTTLNGTMLSYDEYHQSWSRRDDQKVYRYMLNVHQDETHFINSLIKIRQELYGGKKIWNLDYAWGVARDCTRMVEDILMRDLDYKVEYENNLHEFHETLTRDLERYRNPYMEIPYSEEEVSIYNREIEGYKFVLAKSNHELTRVGSEQNICVGGYGDRAVNKSCVIVLVYSPQGEQVITIELNKQWQNSKAIVASQAKLRRNGRPAEYEANIVAEWCYETNTVWDSCYDLANARVDFPRIPGGQAPEWAESPEYRRPQYQMNKRALVYKKMGLDYLMPSVENVFGYQQGYAPRPAENVPF